MKFSHDLVFQCSRKWRFNISLATVAMGPDSITGSHSNLKNKELHRPCCKFSDFYNKFLACKFFGLKPGENFSVVLLSFDPVQPVMSSGANLHKWNWQETRKFDAKYQQLICW